MFSSTMLIMMTKCLLIGLGLSLALANRVQVTFDYGWRHQLYDPPGTPSQCAFDDRLTGLICDENGTDLQYTPQGKVPLAG
jgi:hypothetical protein